MERLSRRKLLVGGGAVILAAWLVAESLDASPGQQKTTARQALAIDPATDQEKEERLVIAKRYINPEYFGGAEPTIEAGQGIQRLYPSGGETAEHVERVIQGGIKTASGQDFHLVTRYDYDTHNLLVADLSSNHGPHSRPIPQPLYVPGLEIVRDQTGLISEDTLESLLRGTYNLPSGLDASIKEFTGGWTDNSGSGQYRMRGVVISGTPDAQYYASMNQQGDTILQVSFNK